MSTWQVMLGIEAIIVIASLGAVVSCIRTPEDVLGAVSGKHEK